MIITDRSRTNGKILFRLGGIAGRIAKRIANRRTRNMLLSMDERMLKDIGITRGDISNI